jgi:hypothetical protein
MESQLGEDLRHLAASQPFTPDLEAIGHQAHKRHRRNTMFKVGGGAGVAAVAAAAVIVASAPQSVAPAPQAVAPAPAVVGGSPLTRLAASITAAPAALTGDSTVLVTHKTIGGRTMDTSYELFTDAGAHYPGGSKATLQSAVAHGANDANGMYAAVTKAALYAASGNLTSARTMMVNATGNCWGLGLSSAAQQAIWTKCTANSGVQAKLKANGVKSLPRPTGAALQNDINNAIWTNSEAALLSGASRPQVRAGVLRLLSTIPNVTVTKGVTNGQATYTIAGGAALFGGAAETLVVSVTTGLPVKETEAGSGKVPAAAQTFTVERTTLSAVKAGKF